MTYPSRRTVRRLCRDYNRIPVYRELGISELGLIALLKALLREDVAVFFESARENKTWSRYSFLGLSPKRIVSFSSRGVVERSQDGEEHRGHDFFAYLKEELGRYRSPSYGRFGAFGGGLAGYFGYELVNHTGILRQAVKVDESRPLALLAHIDDFVVHDNRLGRLYIAHCMYPDPSRPFDKLYDETIDRLDGLERRIIELVERTTVPFLPSSPDSVTLAMRLPREEYMENVRRARELITAGEAIQAVLSVRGDILERIDPYSFYLKLRALNPSPYMFFLKFGDLHIAGSSPETHVRMDRGEVFLKPIAGTIRRGSNRNENERNKSALLADPKERAEHLMLVDLARNDLGRIAAAGSVRVESFMRPEDYSHVIHLVSLVRASLAGGRDATDVLRETFPAGTVSGAPKVRAIEMIDELERHPRHIYAGAIGYLGFDGNLDTCIAIRTAVFSPGEQYLQAGAGIVYDSVPEREYEEVLHKMGALAESLGYARAREVQACS